MANFREKINALIHEDYNFKFGEYIGRSFDLVKKEWGLFMVFTLVMMVITTVAGMIPILGQLASWLILSPCLTAGFFLAFRKVESNEKLSFGDLFKGFDHVSNLVVLMIFQFLIIMALMIPVGLFAYLAMDMNSFISGTFNTTLLLPFFLFLLPMIYLGISWSWSILFVIYYDMDAWPAMEASRKLISKHWFLFFAFLFVGGLICLGGMACLIIGILFAIPVVYGMLYTSFADVTKLEIEWEDDISKHLVE